MIKITNKSSCCGCSACANVCPKSCIKMLPDEKGFLYPSVDESSCIKCGLCEKACPIKNVKEHALKKEAYASYNKDEEIRALGSSGGLFGCLGEEIIKRGGAVFGAAWEPGCKIVKHIGVTTKEDLRKLYGSKYLQSEMRDAYKEAKQYLEDGKYVLFTGTSCQINGLKLFLRKDYEKLITVDVICHGTPSPKVWGGYVASKEASMGSPVVKAEFRNKRFGWQRSVLLLLLLDGREYCELQSKDPYIKGFLSNIYLRDSCYECACKGNHASSDITLGDFWGIERVLPDLDPTKGVSAIILNTDKGKDVFDSVKDRLFIKEVAYEDVLAGNLSLEKPVKKPAKSETFWKLYDQEGFDEALNQSLKVSFPRRCYHLLRRAGNKIKRSVKRNR